METRVLFLTVLEIVLLCFLLKLFRYDTQLSALRTSTVNPALELPIPIVDVPLNRFSEPNLRCDKRDTARTRDC